MRPCWSLIFFFLTLIRPGAPCIAAVPSSTPVVPVALSCAEKANKFLGVYRDLMGTGDVQSVTGAILDRAVSVHRIPGGRVIVGDRERDLFSVTRGTLSLDTLAPVTSDTLYDVASLTKILATATSIMILRERGAVSLQGTLGTYLPEFAGSEIGKVSLERLLRHRDGLRDVAFRAKKKRRSGAKQAYLRQVLREGLEPDPAKRHDFRYTDAAYILLGEVVERVSGQPLDQFAGRNIYEPLGMRHTRYLPLPGSVCARALRTCQVHDPLAFAFGGVSGNAGLFSTAEDVAIFARMILNDGAPLLSAGSVRLMTTDPDHHENLRGLGFDIDTDYSCAPRGGFSRDSFGHTGYTGTSLWIDRLTQTFVVLLTNEADIAKGPIDAIRWCVAQTVASGG